MNLSNDIISELIDYVNKHVYVYASAVRGYENVEPELPLHHFVVAFSTYKNNVKYFLQDTLDENTQQVTQEYCTTRDLVIKMTTFCYIKKSGMDIYLPTEQVLQKLNNRFAGQMKGYDIGKLQVDEELKAYKVESYLYFEFEECPAEDVTNAGIYPEPEFACRNHAKNETIHLTAAQKQYLESPVVCGSYTGNGSTSNHDIDLGFKPKAVIIFRAGRHIVSEPADGNAIYSFLGMCCSSGSIRGCNVLDNGFRVRTNSSNLVDGVNCDFNAADAKYVYIAFR